MKTFFFLTTQVRDNMAASVRREVDRKQLELRYWKELLFFRLKKSIHFFGFLQNKIVILFLNPYSRRNQELTRRVKELEFRLKKHERGKFRIKVKNIFFERSQ